MARRVLIPLTVAPLAWAAHLGSVYAMTAVICARPALRAEGLIMPVVAVVTLAALMVAGWALLRSLRGGSRMDGIGVALSSFSLVAIAWDGLPVLLVPPCG